MSRPVASDQWTEQQAEPGVHLWDLGSDRLSGHEKVVSVYLDDRTLWLDPPDQLY